MDDRQHPIEAVHRARDLLEQAASRQDQHDLAENDLSAYGSALSGTLASLEHLTEVLVGRIAQLDRDQLRRRALYDHPDEAIDEAVRHLTNLRGVLNAATAEGNEYWSETSHVRNSVRDPGQERPGADEPDHG